MFVVYSVAGAYVSLRRDLRVYFIESFLSLLCSAVDGARIVWGDLCSIFGGSLCQFVSTNLWQPCITEGTLLDLKTYR